MYLSEIEGSRREKPVERWKEVKIKEYMHERGADQGGLL